MTRMTLLVPMAMVLAIGFFSMACDETEEDSSSSPSTPCEKMTHAICSQACDCSDNCSYFVDGMSSSADDYDLCYSMDVSFNCDGSIEMDFGACEAGAGSAECDSSGTLQLPESCYELSDW